MIARVCSFHIELSMKLVEINLMFCDDRIIDNIEELESFLIAVENGSFGLEGIAGIALATNNADGRHFVAVLDDNHQLLLARWVTDEVFQNGQELVRNGPNKSH